LILENLEEGYFDRSVFKEKFYSEINKDMKGFIFSDLFFDGKSWERESYDEKSFLERMYSLEESSGGLVLKRGRIGKRILLRASDDVGVNFPVYFYFEFEGEYLIRERGGKFSVERV
jgi:hypothetical protein